MGARSVLGWALTVGLVAVAASMVAGQVLGIPLLIGYVETGSMDPTLAVGDGYVAVPPALAGGVSEGDVVAFDAQSLDGGGMTTHRVMEETPEGYVTRGDANAFTDQEAGEPPVQDSQIAAVALEVNGELIVIPQIGVVAEGVQGGVASVIDLFGIGAMSESRIGAATTAFGAVLVVFSLIYGMIAAEGRSTSRKTSRVGLVRSRWFLLALVVILAVPIMTSMVIPAESDDVQILSSQNADEDDPTQIPVGESETIDYEVGNSQFVPKVVVLEGQSRGVEFSEPVVQVSHGERVESTLTISAPEETGVYVRSRSEHHYHHVLPTPVILALHDVHPFVAMTAVCLVIVSPVVFLFALLVGFRPISVRPVHD